MDLIFLIYLCLGNQADPALHRYESGSCHGRNLYDLELCDSPDGWESAQYVPLFCRPVSLDVLYADLADVCCVQAPKLK